MADFTRAEDNTQKETSRSNEYFAQANYQPGLIVPPHYFPQHLYYPYVNPYSHLTEANGNLSVHGYGSDGRPKFRRSRTIFNSEQLDILEQHFAKYKYPDIKRRRAIAEEVGLPEERVQVWFQNRRAKNKRQTDQDVKLQELVDQAISTNSGNEQRFQSNSDNGFSAASQQNGERCQENLFGRPRPHDAEKESENYEVRAFHGTETKFSRLKECELIGDNTLSNTNLGSREIVLPENHEGQLSEKTVNPAVSQNSWLQPNGTGFGTPEAQVIVQNIDQDLLCKVANILSASNDANSLITEWSQAPNKTQTSNLEEQLRHFAEHNQQVLRASQDGIIIPTSSSQTALQKD